MRAMPSWGDCSPSKREALDMIVHKMHRILSGAPDYEDHWDDIAGYADLAAFGRVRRMATALPAPTSDDASQEAWVAFCERVRQQAEVPAGVKTEALQAIFDLMPPAVA